MSRNMAENKETTSKAVEAIGKIFSAKNKDVQNAEQAKQRQDLITKLKKEASDSVTNLHDHPDEFAQQAQAEKQQRAGSPEFQGTKPKEHLADVLKTTQSQHVRWLVSDMSEVNENTSVMITVSRIAEAPYELQTDPHFLLSEGAKLYYSTDWASLTSEAKAETENVLKRISNKVVELKYANAGTPDALVLEKKEVLHHLGIEDTETVRQQKKLDEEIIRAPNNQRHENLGDELLSGIDQSDYQDSFRKRLDGIREVVNSTDPENRPTVSLLKGWANEIESQIENIRNIDPKRRAELQLQVDRMRSRIDTLQQEDRIPSTIMLTQDEVKRLLNNPIQFLEWMSIDIESLAVKRGFDSPIIEQRLNRYRLLTDYFASTAYDEEKGIGLDFQNLSTEQKIRLRSIHNKLLDRKSEILDQYTDRLHALEFSYTLAQVGDFEKDNRFTQILTKLGERGAFGSRKQWGGLSEVALQKIRRIHQEMLQNPETGVVNRSTPEVMELVFKKVKEEFWEERDIWGPRFSKYFQSLGAGAEGVIPNADSMVLTEDACGSITRIAGASYQLFFEKEQIMARGSGPGAGKVIQKIDSFLTANAEEKILASYQIRDWFFRKWNGLTDAMKASWNQRCLYYIAKDEDLQKWVNERAFGQDGLWDRIQAKKQDWTHVTPGDAAAQKRIEADPLYHELKLLFQEYEQSDEYGGGGDFGKEIRFFANISRQNLERQTKIDIGGEWAQMQAARPYGYWQSGPRRELVQNAINEHPLYGKFTDKLFLGGKTFARAKEYFHPLKERMRSPKKKQDFINQLNVDLRYRPQLFYKLRYDVGLNGRPLPLAEQELYGKTTRIFTAIQSKCMLDAVAPIEYDNGLAGLTGGDIMKGRQQQVINDVFRSEAIQKLGLTKEQYFTEMQRYYRTFTTTADINHVPTVVPDMTEFSHMKYAKAFSFVLWTDDIPLGGLESKMVFDDTNKAIWDTWERESAVGQQKGFRPISEKSTEGRTGTGGLWRRSWNDGITALGLVPAEVNTLGVDEKKVLEAIATIKDKVGGFQGHAEGRMSALEASVGYLGMIKVKDQFTDYGKGLKNSSLAKQYVSETSPSLALDQLEEAYDKIEGVLGEKFERDVTGPAEAAKAYLKITDWRNNVLLGGDHGLLARVLGEERFDKVVDFLNERAPSGILKHKIDNTGLVILAILGLYTFSAAKKGGEEEGKK